MAYYFFYDKTNSPIVYYSSVIVNITALLWSVIVKEYKPLEEHILKYRQDHGWFHVRRIIKKQSTKKYMVGLLYRNSSIFVRLSVGVKITTKSVVIIKIAMFLAFMRKLLIPVY